MREEWELLQGEAVRSWKGLAAWRTFPSPFMGEGQGEGE